MSSNGSSHDDLQALAARYEAGETFEALALDVGVSTKTMYKRLRPHVTPRAKGQRKGTTKQHDSRVSKEGGQTLDPRGTMLRPSIVRRFR